ncbi:AMP-binding protein [Sphingobium yanoikuyae]|uniref:AMP-binding protein n=1 Tax=Sphingobium yanoikuyae TaxID=13690 RepID=UPI0028A89831|nr:AMP-binding protein [Sphingobium yanoikuyae]
MAGLLSALIQRAERAPNSQQFISVSSSGEEVVCTAASLLYEGRRYASAYLAKGAQPGQAVLISLKPGPDLFHAFIGALIVGCVPSMMPFPSAKQDPKLFWHSHRALFQHIGGGIFVTFEDNVPLVSAEIPSDLLHIITPAYATAQSPTAALYPWDEEAVCCLQHSSGTTGLKKGVTLTFSAIEAQVNSYKAALGLKEDDTIVSWLPLYHDMGFVATFLMPLVTGNKSVIMSPFDWTTSPMSLFDLLVRHDGRFVWLPNFAFNHLVNAAFEDEPVRDLSGIKAFINCSEPCKSETFDRFAARFAEWGIREDQLQVCYAMAETIFSVSQTQIGQIVKRIKVSKSALQERSEILLEEGPGDVIELLSNGPLLNGIELRTQGSGVGEIQVRGEFVFKGYYKNPDQTAKAFEGDWYRTGDIGFIYDEEVYILGREKDLIIVYGKNFFAHEIEALVSTVPGVKAGRVAAFGIFNDRVGSEEAILVAEMASPANDAGALRTDIKKILENAIGLVPKKIMIVEQGWLVKSTSGKVSRKENRAKYIEYSERSI